MLEAFWPTDEAVRECLKVDAEAADPAVLLAVHQPMRLRRRNFGAGPEEQLCGEEQVLEALLAKTADARVIVPIVGNSGVGKSHVIRWLAAQLEVAPGHERRVVLRIAKGQSLKEVVRSLLALEALRGPRFRDIRNRLAIARDKMSEEDTANLLLELLAQRVGAAANEAAQEIARGNRTDLRDRQKAYGRVYLPNLLRDPVLREKHWRTKPGGQKGPVAQLVESFTTGVKADRADVRKAEFEPNDFMLDPNLPIGELGKEIRIALGAMALGTPMGSEGAAQVLNASLDDAKGLMLGLESTVSELFDELRVKLLEEGKELVLLIEDFSVLSGMQKQLLQAVIREGVRDGRQVRCTLRTALAYTEGSSSYVFDDTYRSRAKTEWLVPEEEDPTTEKVLDRAVDLVAAYLNAARVGVAGLRDALTRAKRDDRGRLDGDWVPPFEARLSDQERAALASFKVGEKVLFPLNRSALARLVRESCQHGKPNVYNPRLILQEAVLKTLDLRHEFTAAPCQFPGPAFVAGDVGLPPAIENVLKDHQFAPAEKQRLRRVLGYWYDDARTGLELRDRPVEPLAVFGIDHDWIRRLSPGNQRAGGRAPNPPEPAGPPPGPVGGGRPAPIPPPPQRTVEQLWNDDLSAWRSTTRSRTLTGERSTKIRSLVASALDGGIDWQWFNLKLPANTVERLHRYVYVPNSSGGVAGQRPEDALAVLCGPEDLNDPSRSAVVQDTILALVRYFDVHHSSWDYEGAESDAAHYCGLVEAQVPQATAFVRARPFHPAVADPIDLLASGVALAARCSGILGSERKEHEHLIRAMFDADANRAALKNVGRAGGDPWEDLRAALLTWSWGRREAGWSDWLLELVAARQGGEPLAINAGRLKRALERVTTAWEMPTLPAPLKDAIWARAAEGGPITHAYPDPRTVKVSEVLSGEVARIRTWLVRAEQAFGEIRDVSGVTSALEAVEAALDACNRAGHAVGKIQEIRAAARAIKAEAVPELFAACRSMVEIEDRGSQLALRSRHPVELERAISAYLERTAAHFSMVEANLTPETGGGASDLVGAEMREQVNSVRDLQSVFERGGRS